MTFGPIKVMLDEIEEHGTARLPVDFALGGFVPDQSGLLSSLGFGLCVGKDDPPNVSQTGLRIENGALNVESVSTLPQATGTLARSVVNHFPSRLGRDNFHKILPALSSRTIARTFLYLVYLITKCARSSVG